MNKNLLMVLCLLLSACAQSPYRLKISNRMANNHGSSVYLRSNMRSGYAMQIRQVLSRKFSEIGIRTATSADIADFVGIFDIETFYPQEKHSKLPITLNTTGPLFASADEGNSLDSAGNDNMVVDREKTCFTLKIGRKDTSKVEYDSSFCSQTMEETEDMLQKVLNIYDKYASYDSADISVQCLNNTGGTFDCEAVTDKKKAFINSLWIDSNISDDY